MWGFVRRTALLVVLILAAANPSAADPGLPTADPAALTAGTSASVLVTSLIADEALVPTSVNVQRLDAAGRAVAVLGSLRDDGLNGDLLAGDRVFSGRVSIAATGVGQVRIRVSAALRGVLVRATSPAVAIDVLPPGIPTRPRPPDMTRVVTDSQGHEIISNELLACFADGVDVPAIQAIAASVAAAMVGRLTGLGNCYQLQLAEPSTAATVESAVQVLTLRVEVTMVAPHRTVRPAAVPVERDPSFVQVRLPQAHAFGRGAGVIVAVLDSGVNYADARLQPVIRGANVTTLDPLAMTDPMDEDGHGTAVAGIVRGAAPASSILAVKVLGPTGGSVASVSAGIVAAVNAGARVLNMSFAQPGYDLVLAAAITYARLRDRVLVAAAGNEGTSNPQYPAALEGVIAVGNIDSGDRPWPTSSRGFWLDLSAPGVTIQTTGLNGSDVAANGTSFAAPFVAGAAALILGSNPTRPAATVAAMIRDNAVTPPGWDPSMGAGRLDALAALTGMHAIDVTPEDPVVGVGRTVGLFAAARGVRGQPVPFAAGTSIEWSTADVDIALVDPQTGVVTAVSPGEVEITAVEVRTSDAVDAYCLAQGFVVCPVEKLEGEVRETPSRPRRRLRVTVVDDPVSGVYELVRFNGDAVPVSYSTGVSLLSGEARLNEPRDGFPDWPLMMTGVFRFAGVPAHTAEQNFSYTYVVGDVSAVPVPFANGRVGPGLILPPGLVINATTLRAGETLPIATLASNGRTLTLAGGSGYIATFERRAPPRAVRIEPLNRELTFPATRQGAQSPAQTITVYNTGTDPLAIHPQLIYADGSFTSPDYRITGTCPHGTFGTLAPGESCQLNVVFAPRVSYHTGERPESLTIRTNAGSTSGDNFTGVTFDLSGEATGVPIASITPTEVAFPETFAGRPSFPRVVTVRNDGTIPLRLGVPELPSANFSMDAAGCSDQDLPPGGSCAITLVFTPAVFEDVANRSAVLRIPTNGGSTSGDVMQETLVPLSGFAVYSAPVAHPGFGRTVTAGTPVTLDGGLSSDPQGRPLTYRWFLLFSPQGSNAAVVNPFSRVAGLLPDVAGQYIVVLVVNNGYWDSPTVGVEITATRPPDPPPSVSPPRVTAPGELTLSGDWTLQFFSGDDDEPSWVTIGNDPEFEWEEDETPGLVVPVRFGATENTIRITEGSRRGPRPLVVEDIGNGRYLIYLHDDDPPNELEVILILVPASP